MVKSKNHTAHNLTAKNHKNGIKKIPKMKHLSMKGVCPKFLKNRRYALKSNKKTAKK